MTLATLLHLRNTAGATQEDIARRLGMGIPFVQRIEDGTRTLTNGIVAMYVTACADQIKGVPFEVHALAGSSEAADGFPASAWCTDGCGSDGATATEAVGQLVCLHDEPIKQSPTDERSYSA